ncbi:GNAT family N-acetyltransferase [Brevibacillus borstelensis]|uniref:GNAT family N-acetyltransferase n=1 Tax=Brevibacillus borstelensis TaxID=45462 RepID=UPI0030C626DD
MIKLRPDHYSKAARLLDEVPFNNLFARVVIENKVNGQVLVDDPEHPTVCLIIHKYGMALLCGNDRNESFNNGLANFLSSGPSSEYSAKWLLASPDEWEHKLASLLVEQLLPADKLDAPEMRPGNHTHFLKTERINYRFHSQLCADHTKIPDGFTLKKIDAELYHSIQGSVVPQYFWNTAEDFLANGIGFALLYDDQIVSTSFASFIVGDKLELGVETTETFRKRGYSIYAASALVAYCLENGYEPVWACRRGNIGSSRLAESLGFVPASYHPYYCILSPTSK